VQLTVAAIYIHWPTLVGPDAAYLTQIPALSPSI